MDPYKYTPSDSFNTATWTTNTGMPVYDARNSLSVGPNGPLLLEDFHLLESLAQFDRERIPERIVHARGASAYGQFECTADLSDITFADFLRAPGTKTPLVIRFSTVIHERDSPETLRDPRGFAIKFYTREGNFDMVGNNFPVFFIRNGIDFVDVVHAFKPNPQTHQQEGWRIMDFLSYHPECCHMLTFLLDDVGIPANYRQMDGFGVHTFKLISKDGKETLVKFHWKTQQGVQSLLDDEAVIVGGTCHSHATKDLFDSIDAGKFPEWKLFIQTMPLSDQHKYDFDPLDVTKTWPEDQFPLKEVGRMVLDRNIDNFFLENEMLAFCPATIVPGITYTDDKMFQARAFSYNDAQRYRLGPNYLLLPPNAPRCAYHNNHHGGAMNFTLRKSEVNYFPSLVDKVKEAPNYPTSNETYQGKRERRNIDKENNFAQAGARFRSFDEARKQRFVTRVSGLLNGPRVTVEIKRIWLHYWTQCDKDLGARLAKLVKLSAAQ
eukprot:ANDGO_04144.mRNA.1 Catalase isozyme 1